MYQINTENQKEFVDFSKRLRTGFKRPGAASILHSCRNPNLSEISALTIVSYLLALFTLAVVVMTYQSTWFLVAVLVAVIASVLFSMLFDYFKRIHE